MCICVHVIYIYVNINIYMWKCVYIYYIYVNLLKYVCIHMYIYIYIYMCIHTHTYIYIYTRINQLITWRAPPSKYHGGIHATRSSKWPRNAWHIFGLATACRAVPRFKGYLWFCYWTPYPALRMNEASFCVHSPIISPRTYLSIYIYYM